MTHIPEKNGKSVVKHNGEKNGKATQEEVVQPPPPDGGWGWVVVFASFMVHVITDGVTYSYGIFHADFLLYFGASDQAVSWITSLLVGVTYCSGPISSALVNRFGCQAVTIMGTLVASACLLASVYAKDLTVLYFTAGIGTGFGFGLIYLPAIVSVTVYFEKYRSLATGIAVCGSGLGTVVFAPFISYLISVYGSYKSAMMILSAIVLNCVVLGIMFRPLEPVKSSECIPLKEVKSNGRTNLQSCEDAKLSLDRRSSMGAPKKYSNAKSSDNSSSNIRLALSQPILASKDGQQQSEPFPRVSCGSGVMNRSDVFLRSSIHSIRKRSESLTNSEENMRFRLSLRSLPNGAGHRVVDVAECEDENENPGIIKRMLQLDLLRDPVFIIFSLSNFFTSLGFNVPYVFLVKQAETHDIDKETASMLISVIGFANTAGRIVLGYISDKPWVNRLFIYNVCLTVCGLSTAFSPFCTDFLTLAIYSAIFGFTAGAYVGLTSVCLVDLVGLDRLTNAFGLVLLFQGIASFLGAPIAGYLRDVTGSYDPGFSVAGIMIAASGLMLFVVPPLQRCLLKKEEKQQRIEPVA
ncbi:monocarboxylate transporter 13 isoform X1 [Nasonia vitripennis]|uniref:Major facilitator superfamily (MFS) profile domain-containing protein n=2 Tax=Nasonia vitripennis TaxID=7425 RepID=A0A7M7Q0Q8_NASVI|nr:monocarboxylate transporter 13 isoform X1 [Nasonia vitripennis]XP_031779087.1 monocarboxylate transporter 13 isoform X1 [Nasonia vitripennis]XP_031779088.1 monocarboxylate transporter 13 isoform X1 [Nasonia vitripennis]XP_032452462.1 monocarboxylate transporter 13 isoform X1 [Nasonia vitripennis]